MEIEIIFRNRELKKIKCKYFNVLIKENILLIDNIIFDKLENISQIKIFKNGYYNIIEF